MVSAELDRDELQSLLRAARELAAISSLDELASCTCAIVRRSIAADGTKIVLPREHVVPDDALAGFIAGYAARHHESLAIADLAHDGRVPTELRRTVAKSLIVVPVRTAQGGTAGLGVFWARPDGPTPRAIAVLEMLAGFVAPALAHAQQLAAETDARRHAERMVRAKTDLLDALGHELRNPLAPIITALHLIELRGADPHERERTIIRGQVGTLVRVVDDMLDVSRISRGILQLRRTRSELAWIVSRGIDTAAPALSARGHTVIVTIPESGLAIDADIDRMTQVIANLVTNAANETPRGGRIEVIAAIEGEGDGDGRCARLVVRDTGCGIDPTDLPAVFEPVRRPGELRLGLALVRSFVELHGGVVSAASEGPGRGSTYTIRLPLSEVVDTVSDEPPPRAKGTRPLRVLVVDENVESACTLGELLSLMGHQAVVVHDGVAALETAERFSPDVTFLDIGLPIVDGYQLAERMRALPAKAPLVALVGFARPADRQRARDGGFDGHVVKPLSAEKLRRVIEKLT